MPTNLSVKSLTSRTTETEDKDNCGLWAIFISLKWIWGSRKRKNQRGRGSGRWVGWELLTEQGFSFDRSNLYWFWELKSEERTVFFYWPEGERSSCSCRAPLTFFRCMQLCAARETHLILAFLSLPAPAFLFFRTLLALNHCFLQPTVFITSMTFLNDDSIFLEKITQEKYAFLNNNSSKFTKLIKYLTPSNTSSNIFSLIKLL